MTETTPRYARRQQLGKRMGTEPYYTIAEHTDNLLVLRSRPKANVNAGRMFIAVGGILILVALAFFCVGMSTYLQGVNIGLFLVSSLASAPCGVVGLLGVIGGLAITRTTNTITVDMDTRTITYSQKSRRERQQFLDFDQIAYLRLSTQPFSSAFFFKRPQPIAVLELITNENVPWLVDSAADASSLEPVAEALSSLLDVEVRRNLDASNR